MVEVMFQVCGIFGSLSTYSRGNHDFDFWTHSWKGIWIRNEMMIKFDLISFNPTL